MRMSAAEHAAAVEQVARQGIAEVPGIAAGLPGATAQLAKTPEAAVTAAVELLPRRSHRHVRRGRAPAQGQAVPGYLR